MNTDLLFAESLTCVVDGSMNKPCDSIRPQTTALRDMGELYEDRRQEPRFSAAGKYRLRTANGSEIEGRVLDLSLNGVLLEHSSSTQLQEGSHHSLTLEFAGQPAFYGDTLVIWADSSRIGIEFYDMDPQNFAALTALIDALDHAHR